MRQDKSYFTFFIIVCFVFNCSSSTVVLTFSSHSTRSVSYSMTNSTLPSSIVKVQLLSLTFVTSIHEIPRHIVCVWLFLLRLGDEEDFGGKDVEPRIEAWMVEIELVEAVVEQ